MPYIDFNFEQSESINAFYFHGGEPHVSIPDYEGTVQIYARITTWEEYGFLLMFLSALNAQKAVTGIDLYLPYFPGARQDRNPKGNTPLTPEVYAAGIIGSILRKSDKTNVYTFDIHSQAAFDIIGTTFDDLTGEEVGFYNIEPAELDRDNFDQDIVGIIIPDEGAKQRAIKFRYSLFPDVPLIQFDKKREFDTGKITDYQIVYDSGLSADNYITDPEDLVPGKYLVVDDICDGGATFVLLAQAWKAIAPAGSELQLYVSHGIFSKTPEVLEGHYSKVYTTDTFPHPFYDLDFPFITEFPPPSPFEAKVLIS